VEALHAAGGGHYGGALSVVDILHALYRNRPIDRRLMPGDKLILSKGHAAIALYAVLQALGYLESDLTLYGSFGSGLEGHPDMLATPEIHFSTGSLGQGLGVGLGMALALREINRHVWVVLGDGECQEGQVWEAAMLAARYRVGNLHAVVDCNRAQECGWRHDPSLEQTPLPDGLAKWLAFGWQTREIDGHDHLALDNWIADAVEITDRPSIALAQTRKGRGVSLFEAEPEKYHCKQLSEEEIRQVRSELQSG
jgi:transketolase